MKVYLNLLVCIFVLFSCNQVKKGVNKFEDKKGRFKISFPTKPTLKEEPFTTLEGETTQYVFISEPKLDDNISYSVSYIDYPKEFTDIISTENTYNFFATFNSMALNSKKVELIGLLNQKVLGYTGREFRFKDIQTGMFSRTRMYLVDNRVYILTINTKEEKNFNLGINAFFDSFELINTQPNPKAEVQTENAEKIYTIKFNNPTEIKETEAVTEYGDVRIVLEGYQPKLENDENIAYMVSTLTYSQDITQNVGFDLDEYYLSIIRAGLNGRQSTLISKKEISVSGISGIETKESLKEGKMMIKQRILLKGKSQIAIQVVTIPLKDENESMNEFLNSFKFIEK
ncbi:hypothetical protein V9L05_22515 (plasmid) [Bernardetia sp. Wsw4-3y2]|uniref:hypothetical protein n=1 Tax=Bernardetia sp. Wsw4-3y2 TaxID=3127471 RepID=UPI0030CDB4BA